MTDGSKVLSRRQALQILAVLGITGPAAAKVLAQEPSPITPEVLRAARALLASELTEERLEALAPAVRWNLHWFDMVRDLEIDDLVEPAPIFSAAWD